MTWFLFFPRFYSKTRISTESKEEIIFITFHTHSCSWGFFSKMQQLGFPYADWGLTLSQALWHKISQRYPSKQCIHQNKKLYRKSHTHVLQKHFPLVLCCMQATQRLDRHTCTYTNTHAVTPILLSFIISVQNSINNHHATMQDSAIYAQTVSREKKGIYFP